MEVGMVVGEGGLQVTSVCGGAPGGSKMDEGKKGREEREGGEGRRRGREEREEVREIEGGIGGIGGRKGRKKGERQKAGRRKKSVTPRIQRYTK